MEPFKTFLGPPVIEQIADVLCGVLHEAGRDFDRDQFVTPLLREIEPLEMKARAGAIAKALDGVLPEDFALRAKILSAMLHPETTGAGDSDATGLRGWAVWPLTILTAQTGLHDPDCALALLREMTMRFTAEFDIRPFLIQDQPAVLAVLEAWLDDPNEHVRRLISEGSRPRLPWGVRLVALVDDPTPMLPILTRLRDDPSDYVRRSVANHLNDISKDHPDLICRLAAEWMVEAPPMRAKLLRHALRGLIKAGNPEALAVFGQHPPQVEGSELELSHDVVRMGSDLELQCDLRSTATVVQDLTIDYVLWLRKADGQLRPKVFKGARVELAPGDTVRFERRHKFREVTTRRHYSGTHEVGLRINGRDFAKSRFELQV